MKYIYLENWREEQKLTSLGINTKLAVIDNESLTKRLCFNKKSSFKVIVENQYLTHSKNSMDFLNTKEISSLGIYRNVKLISNGNKTVSAQSFFPVRYLHGKERYITIGNFILTKITIWRLGMKNIFKILYVLYRNMLCSRCNA